jgi:hypothetical protein
MYGRGKLGKLSLYMSSTLWCDNCNSILKVSWVAMHYYMSNVINGYPNHQWYDHIDIVKDVELLDVVYQNEYRML